jgi:hypothetical protein
MSEDAAARLRSEIAQLEARYDGGAMPPGIYLLVVRLRNELARMERGGSDGYCRKQTRSYTAETRQSATNSCGVP